MAVLSVEVPGGTTAKSTDDESSGSRPSTMPAW